MKKKILSICLVIALAATAVIGGTLAYFTDAEQTTNTMTLGNIEINLEEVKLVDNAWVELDNDEPINLFPIKWEDRAEYGMSNNKAARVYNTSSSGNDAYLRTIIAFPHSLDQIIGLGFAAGEAWNATGTDGVKRYGCEWEKQEGTVTIDGVLCDIYVCDTVNGAKVEKGNYMLSLTSVWMYDTVTNEDIEKVTDLKVTDDGKYTFPIKVLSQGVQTEGFADYDEAMASFGDVMENVVTWFSETEGATINDIITNN